MVEFDEIPLEVAKALNLVPTGNAGVLDFLHGKAWFHEN